MVFSDRQDAVYETLFIIHAHEMLIVKHVFPTPPTEFSELYLIQNLTEQNIELLHKWAYSDGDAEPPFVPSGPWRARVDVTADGQERLDTVWFANENEYIAADFANLSARYQTKELMTPELPEWLRDSGVLMPFVRTEE